jgi:hypothetical protein
VATISKIAHNLHEIKLAVNRFSQGLKDQVERRSGSSSELAQVEGKLADIRVILLARQSAGMAEIRASTG